MLYFDWLLIEYYKLGKVIFCVIMVKKFGKLLWI